MVDGHTREILEGGVDGIVVIPYPTYTGVWVKAWDNGITILGRSAQCQYDEENNEQKLFHLFNPFGCKDTKYP
jgi:hypothetical protein